MPLFSQTPPSRRQFLATGLAVAGAAALPLTRSWAFRGQASYRRVSMTSSAGIKMLASYKTAITNLMALPPTDGRNWYRNAFIHTLDCPHGNWWLLPWHRAYTGYFEETCREFSGNSEFAFPFWDWTAAPSIPSTFWNDTLDPGSSGYIASLSAFEAEFTNPMSSFWTTLNAAQLKQLAARGVTSMSNIWSQIVGNPMFFPSAQARRLTASNPKFDTGTTASVSSSTINSALQQTTFVNFGSPQASSHEQQAGYGILEGQPHNNVHDDIGGFMQDFLSPVDPLFFMHHSNIDRLWTIWTAKQTANGLPTTPTGSALTSWSEEPFLFFVNAQGNPVGTTTAGAYESPGSFNYTYGAGSNSSVASASVPSARVAVSGQTEPHSVGSTLKTGASSAAVAESTLSPEVRSAVSGGLSLLAQITVAGMPHAHGFRLDVYLNPSPTALLVQENPSFVASLRFVGICQHNGSLTFTIPLLGRLSESGRSALLNSAEPLRLYVVSSGASPMAMSESSMAEPTVTKITILAS